MTNDLNKEESPDLLFLLTVTYKLFFYITIYVQH